MHKPITTHFNYFYTFFVLDFHLNSRQTTNAAGYLQGEIWLATTRVCWIEWKHQCVTWVYLCHSSRHDILWVKLFYQFVKNFLFSQMRNIPIYWLYILNETTTSFANLQSWKTKCYPVSAHFVFVVLCALDVNCIFVQKTQQSLSHIH